MLVVWPRRIISLSLLPPMRYLNIVWRPSFYDLSTETQFKVRQTTLALSRIQLSAATMPLCSWGPSLANGDIEISVQHVENFTPGALDLGIGAAAAWLAAPSVHPGSGCLVRGCLCGIPFPPKSMHRELGSTLGYRPKLTIVNSRMAVVNFAQACPQTSR